MKRAQKKEEERIKYISPSQIEFNPDNPRGQDYEDKTFIALEESIRNYGVMVPLIVFENVGHGKPYTLLDGERRLKAALKAKREDVPVHVLEVRKDRTESLKRMFQIHMLREQWEPMAQARALKFYVDLLKKRKRTIGYSELIKEVSEITKMKRKIVEDRLRLLRFNEETQQKVLDGRLADSYLVQIEQNFVEQLEKNAPARFFRKYPKSQIRKVLVEKAEKNILPTTRAFFGIPELVSVCKKMKKIEVFTSLARKFLDCIDYTVDDLTSELQKKLQIPTLTARLTPRVLIRNINKLSEDLSKYNSIATPEEWRKKGLILVLKKLEKIIKRILVSIR